MNTVTSMIHISEPTEICEIREAMRKKLLELCQSKSQSSQEIAARSLRILLKSSSVSFPLIVSHLTSLIDLLSQKEPPVGVAHDLLRDAEAEFWRRDGRWPMRTLVRLTGGSRTISAYWGVAVSFLALVAFWIFYKLVLAVIINCFGAELPPFFRLAGEEFAVTCVFALLGGGASVLIRIQPVTLAARSIVEVFMQTFTKPFLGVVFGAVAFVIVKAGIVSVAGIDPYSDGGKMVPNVTPPVSVADAKFLFTAAVLGFLCGFSERFGNDFLSKASGLFLIQPSKGNRSSDDLRKEP
jgi:hypothetical protein